MSYNSIGVPRFFISDIQLMQHLGLSHTFHYGNNVDKGFANITPSNQYTFTGDDNNLTRLDYPLSNSIDFMFVLGHNFKTAGMKTYLYDENTGLAYGDSGIQIVNDCFNTTPQYDGWSMVRFNEYTPEPLNANVYISGDGSEGKASSIVIGKSYTMPHSPDLKLSISYETGTKEQTTRGGATLTNNMWEARKWGDLPAWGFDSYAANPANTYFFNTAPRDRKVWDLSFSYLDKENTFPRYNSYNTLETEDVTDSSDQYTLIGSDDWYSQVWNKVNNQHSFIFQPDNTVNEFAICKIDGRSIKFTQTAFQKYNCKLRIREVW